MALRTIRIMGDEVLTKVCREVKKVTPCRRGTDRYDQPGDP